MGFLVPLLGGVPRPNASLRPEESQLQLALLVAYLWPGVSLLKLLLPTSPLAPAPPPLNNSGLASTPPLLLLHLPLQ